jgi:hypothetical protein
MLAYREAARHAFGLKNPEGLYFENTLGFLYARMRKYAEAREVLAPLEERFLQVLGPEHIDVALYYENKALTEEGLGHLDTAEKLLLKSYAMRKSRLGEGHGLTRRAAAHLSRIYMAKGKTEESIAWLRTLLTAGVVRNGIIAHPAHTTGRMEETPGLPDIKHLADALSGKADYETSSKLLQELGRTLDWLLWRTDWLRANVSSLFFEALSRNPSWRTEHQARQCIAEAIGATKYTISIMEANSTTPPPILAAARERLKRLQETEAKLPAER